MRTGVLVNESTSSGRSAGALTDGVVTALFAGFVLLLFLGYLNTDPGLPFTSVAAALLVGSLGTLSWANWRTDRRARGSAPPPLS